MRELSELIEVEDPAWPVLGEKLRDSPVPVELLDADATRGAAALLRTQVTVRSFLGAFVLHSGGAFVDDGWLRVYGSPAADNDRRLPSLAQVNDFPADATADPGWRPAAGLVVAHDVLGGVFVLQGGPAEQAGLPGRPGEMVYFAPDSLSWEALGAGYGAWLAWMLAGGTEEFYEDLRWPGWQDEVRRLDGDRGLTLYPPLWSAEAHQDLAATSRRVVTMAELLDFERETSVGLDEGDPGFLGNV
ncbi:DUF2625 domain-containing protein [Streptomyces sp. TX20-6-3]|uniref:DUF2625 domain-containing protein n=1 Tax=Streptomyces sp. TX20-6-3 TaxID=3028705 RepID=UPI0029BA000E|nr:DUF2625 domain-containing protein [Streptomyces sp. TX20-6-3]MDX2563763.1 DUF2625 domain-containing protein [Streptomyces sp. TX20-6-3]